MDMELYNKLLKCGIFRANPKVRMNFEKRKTAIDGDTSALIESGAALGKYLIVLKEALKKQNQDLNVDPTKIQQMKSQNNAQTKLFNWNILTAELDKVGILIEPDTKSLIVAGDGEQILFIFARIERFITKILGKQNLVLDGVKSEVTFAPSTAKSDGEKSSNARRGNKPNQKKKVAKEGVDILTMNCDREPHDTESSLELILNTLCRAFQMKPKQAAALLTNNNQFLIHSIVKGVKGRFEPLIAWYQDLYANSKHLTSLLELEMEAFPHSTNTSKVLDTLATGLYSTQSFEICKQCFKMLTKVGFDFGRNQVMYDQAIKWFLQKEGGLELSLYGLRKHPELAEDFVSCVTQFSSINNETIETVYKTELKKHFSSPLEYVNIVNDLFPFLMQEAMNEVRKSGILDFWIESCIRQSDNDGKHSFDERISALTLLTEMWLAYTDHVDKKDEWVTQIQSMLKRGARDRHRPIRLVAVSLMFRLLDKFSEDKNPSAPSLYKTLIFSLVENPNESIVRELFFYNFTSLFEHQPSVPVNLLVDPLIKQIQMTEGITYHYKIFDFDFFSIISKHPKLNSMNAIPLADLLAKIYLNDVSYSSVACVPFMQLCSRYLHDYAMQEFIIKFLTICLSMLMGLEKNAEELQFKHQQMLLAKEQAAKGGPRRLLALPAPPQPPSIKQVKGKKLTKEERMRKLKEQDEEVTRRLKKIRIVEISMKIQNLKHEDLNDQLRDMLLSTNKRFSELYGFFNKGIMALLKWWGDAEQIMNTYMRAIEEKEAREREERERREREERERQRREQEEKERREKEEKERRQREAEEKLKQLAQSQANIDVEQNRLMLGYDSADQLFREGSMLGSKHASNRNSMAVLPFSGSKMSGMIRNAKAMQQIEKIKRNKLEKEEQKRLEDERKKLLSAKQRKKVKEELEKRKLGFGIGTKSLQNLDLKALIFKGSPIAADNKKLISSYSIPQIELLDLEEEEERDREGVYAIMKKYAKLWKNFYYKYANSGFSSKQTYNFDQLGEKHQTISVAEMTKMLKDHDIYPQLISKDQFHTLLRLVNTRLFQRSDLQALDYPSYQAFMLQLAYFCFTKPPRDLSHLPPAETIRALIVTFEEATRSRGNSTVLFEDPDTTSMADTELIRALTEKLNEDPSYPLPEGFFKQVEKMPIYEYIIPEDIRDQLPESSVIGVELMDELLNSIFGIHIIEPLVTFEERLKVRPMIKNVFKPQQAEALSYMRKVEKKVRPYDDKLNPYARLSAIDKNKLNQEIRPQLNVTLKLEVAQYPLKERPHAQEVAEFLEEALQAVEKGFDFLPPRPNRAPGQVWNEVKQKKADDFQREIDIRIQKEEKRKRRDEQLKIEKEKIEDQRRAALEQARLAREQQEKEEEDYKKRQFKEVKQKIKENRHRIQSMKNEKLEDVIKKREVEHEKTQELNEKKKKENVEFIKTQKKRLQEEFEMLKKQREEVAAKQEIIKQKEIEYQRRIRAEMEEYIKENQQEKYQEQEERKQINEFMKQHDVEAVFSLYDRALKYMYKFYASQDKKDVEFSLEKAMSTMNFREFIRFGYQQMIIPVLLNPEDMVHIYRQLIRERIEEISGGIVDNYIGDKNFAQVLDYDYFKKALIRVALLAQSQLGGGLDDDQMLQRLQDETKKKKRSKKAKGQDDGAGGGNDGGQDEGQDGGAKTKQSSKSLAGGAGAGGQDLEREEETKYEINEKAKAKEDAFFKQWMKQREDKGISLKKRIIGREKEGTTKVVKKKKKVTIKDGKSGAVSGNEGVREGEDLDDDEEGGDKKSRSRSRGRFQVTEVGSTLKKSYNVKKMRELELLEQKTDNINSTKITSIKVSKDLHLEQMNAKILEAFLRFLEIEPEDPRYILDKKLNLNRIEIQGQKPTKFKRQIKPSYMLRASLEGTGALKSSLANPGGEGGGATDEDG